MLRIYVDCMERSVLWLQTWSFTGINSSTYVIIFYESKVDI